MDGTVLKESKEFMDKTQNLLISILNELRETIDIISQVDSTKKKELEGHIVRGVNELSNILNSKIDSMKDEMEFNVNATVKGLMLENRLRLEAITGKNSQAKVNQSTTDCEIIE
ncbi:hypothetical protein FG386_003332 [Cryptosporidium ryanae]|uniref:uncharacterized protein n=1 Tax=Cryptosporidium ryanae TaxID=515981 RepID=UPI00351AAF6B|nr:hypothetical protein FG386_003332 [Cryptosporidium ryanae]